MQDLKAQINVGTNDLNRHKRDMERLSEPQSQNPYAAYGGREGGQSVQKVLRDIEQYAREGRWRGYRPIGPFGLHVKLKRSEYQNIIETLLNDTLNAMGVETLEDADLLRSIMKKHNCKMNVYRCKRDAIQFQSGEASQDYLTVLRCLEIDNLVVLNQLIIHNSIEKTVLVPNHHEGDRITMDGYPHNVIGVYTKDLYACGSRSGGLATYSVRPYKGIFRLSKSTTHAINQMKEQINEKIHQLKAIQEEHDQIAHEFARGNTTKSSLLSETNLYRRNDRELDSRLSNIEDQLQEQEPPNVSALEEFKQEEQGRLNVLETQLVGLQSALTDIRHQYNDAAALCKTAAQEIDQFNETHNNLLEEKQNMEIRIENISKDLSRARIELDRIQTEYAPKKDNLDGVTRALAAKIQDCEKHSARVPVNRPRREIEGEMERLHALVEQSEKK